jgi:nucleoside-diphosphate-sugar epimerase
MTEGLSICAQVPANIARFACKNIVQYDGLRSLVTEFYRALHAGTPAPGPPERARSIVYWTDSVSKEANAAKLKFQSQFPVEGHARVLVTGANGLIGRHLVRRLLLQGTRVRIFVRRQPPPEFMDDSNVEVFLGDLGDPVAVDRAVAGAEMVYHLGATMIGNVHDHERGTVCGTRNIIESVLRHLTGRLLYVSSLSCLHAAASGRGAIVTEDWPVEPSPEKRGAYTQAKTEAEKIVQDAVRDRHLRAVLLRPGRVLGPGATLLTPEVARRIQNFLVILGDGSRELPLVFVEDVVDAILLAAEKSKFDGSVFHIVDPAQITQNQLVRDHVLKNVKNAKVIHMPALILYGLALGSELVAKALKLSPPLSIYRVKSGMARLRFDCSRAEREIDWRPRVGIDSGLREIRGPAPANLRDNGLEPLQERAGAK